jgi:AcrR family transcriptional regulator
MAMQQRAILTQAKVLAAAAEVFSRVGYAGATLNDITAEAETTKGALYFHFASKEALAEAIIEEYFGQLPGMVADVNKYAPNALAALVALTYEAGLRFRDDPAYRAGTRLAMEHSTVLSGASDRFDGWRESVTEILVEARKQKLLRRGVKPEVASVVLLTALVGVQQVSEFVSNRKDLEDRLDEVWKMFLVSLAAEPDWTLLQRQSRKVLSQIRAER